MSDSKHSTITYLTELEYSDMGSPGVDGPPSPDYVPGPEAPPSPIYIPYVPEPEYPEFMPPEDHVFPAEEQPLPAVVSPTADSPGYIPESDPEEEDEEDPEEDPAYYPADIGDDDEEDEEEEHLAFADSTVVALDRTDSIFFISYSPFPQTPSPPPPQILSPPISPTRIEIPESCLPPRKRPRLASPTPIYEVGETSAAGAALFSGNFLHLSVEVEDISQHDSENNFTFKMKRKLIFVIPDGIGRKFTQCYAMLTTAKEMWTAMKGYKWGNRLSYNDEEQLASFTMQVMFQFLQQLQPEWSSIVTVVKLGQEIKTRLISQVFDVLKHDPEQVGGIRICKRIGTPAKTLCRECRKPKRVKDYAYHKEKMMMCKQAEQGVPLRAEQADWLEDTDEEIDEQELEAHYSYMAKIQEVSPAESSSTDTHGKGTKPMMENDVFANVRRHSEQPGIH
ncbi:hypothetical protein Tco_0516739 [Tanacetum coccineum]